MSEIKLNMRYPESRLEDVTDAYMRGFEVGLAMRTDENAKLREQNRYLMKGDLLHVLTDQELAEQQRREREMQASIKALDAENVKLRELVRFMWLADYAGHFSTLPELQEHQAVVWHRMRELVVEV